MELHSLLSIITTRQKRGGQGHGSGRGKTSGRGTKGQKAKRNIPLRFDGANLTILERLPFMRGKGRNKSLKKKPVILHLDILNLLPKGATVDMDTLIKHNMVSAKKIKAFGVKILGDGKLTQNLTVAIPVSKGAREQIERAGGKVTASSN